MPHGAIRLARHDAKSTLLNDTDWRSQETGYDPYRAVAQQEMRNNLHRLLGCLNEREQQVFTSYWMEQLVTARNSLQIQPDKCQCVSNSVPFT